MITLGIDIGGKTMNGFAVTEKDILLESSFIPYNDDEPPLKHRDKLVIEISRLLSLHNVDSILFERIKLYRGRFVSPLANITSLCKVQCAIITNFSDLANIAEVDVRSWKAEILGGVTTDKKESILYAVNKYNPNLDVPNPIKRNPGRMKQSDDIADAICISDYAQLHPELFRTDSENRVNYL